MKHLIYSVLTTILLLTCSVTNSTADAVLIITHSPNSSDNAFGEEANADEILLRQIAESDRYATFAATVQKKRFEASENLRLQFMKLNHLKRTVAVRRLPAGVYVNIPEFWQTQTNPDVVLDALGEFGEPLTDSMLDALARIFPNVQDEQQRLLAAALLYRYDNPIGGNYLRRTLHKKRDSACAVILALNHDKAALADIVALIGQERVSDMEIITPLAGWKNVTVSKKLWNLFRNRPDDKALILAVASQGISKALPSIRRTYKKRAPSDLQLKVACLTAISKLNPSGSEYNTLMSMLTKTDGTGIQAKTYIVQALGVVNETRSTDKLCALLIEYSKLKSGPNLSGITQNSFTAALATTLATFKSVKSQKPMEQLFLTLRTTDVTRTYLFKVADALFRLEGNPAIVIRLLNPTAVRRMQISHTLKPLPDWLQLGSSGTLLKAIGE